MSSVTARGYFIITPWMGYNHTARPLPQQDNTTQTGEMYVTLVYTYFANACLSLLVEGNSE